MDRNDALTFALGVVTVLMGIAIFLTILELREFAHLAYGWTVNK